MTLPKHDQLETVDSLLASISKFEQELQKSSAELNDLIESNSEAAEKEYQLMVKNIKAKKDLEAQSKDLQNLRVQEANIKQEIYTKVLLQVDKSFDAGVYEKFINSFFETFSDKAEVIADKKFKKLIPDSYSVTEGQTNQLSIITETKEYDLGPDSLKKELADKFTIKVLNNISSKLN